MPWDWPWSTRGSFPQKQKQKGDHSLKKVYAQILVMIPGDAHILFFFLVAGNSRERGWVGLIVDIDMTAGQEERSTEIYLPSLSLSLFRCFQRHLTFCG